MWPRNIEFALAGWLAASPFTFGHADDAIALWMSDFLSATIIAILAIVSYWPPARHAHLLIIPVALWLIGWGRFSEAASLSAGLQNEIAVGLTLLMFAIVPNEAARPPRAWYENAEEQ